MDDPGIHQALRALGPDEIDVVKRFLLRLRANGYLGPDTATRWTLALDGASSRSHLRLLQG